MFFIRSQRWRLHDPKSKSRIIGSHQTMQCGLKNNALIPFTQLTATIDSVD